MTQKRKYTFFFIIVIINVLFKCLFAGFASYSFDEIISVKDTLLDFGHIKHEAEWDNNPPFYYYCLWIWHHILPVNEFNSRLLSILFISFSIGLAFLFALDYFDRNTALFTVAFLSISNFLEYYSLEARSYALVVLLVMCSSICFFKYLKNRKVSHLLLLSLLNFLIIYTHYIAGMVVIVQYAIMIFYFRKGSLSFFLTQTVIITTLVFIRFTKKQFHNIFNFNNKNDFWLERATFNDLVHTIKDLYFNTFTAQIFIIVAGIFIYNQITKKEDDLKVKAYCFALGFLSVLFLFLIGVFKPVFLNRYLIFCIPFATMLVSWQLTRFDMPGYGVLAVLIIIQLFYFKPQKLSGMDYRSVANLIKANKKENDYVIINTRDNISLFQYYFNRELFLKYKNIDSICRSQNIIGVNTVEPLQDLKFANKTNVFLVQSFHKLKSKDNPVEGYFSRILDKRYTTNFYKGVELTVFKSN